MKDYTSNKPVKKALEKAKGGKDVSRAKEWRAFKGSALRANNKALKQGRISKEQHGGEDKFIRGK